MKIASAQISVEIGDLKGNLTSHLKMIKLAFDNQVDVIVFPEMSLTSYCQEEASDLSFSLNDKRLDILKEASSINNISIICGAPIRIKNELYIGSFIIQPNSEIEIYTKQFLHKGEAPFFKSSFKYNPILKIENETILFAICADIDVPQHAINASKNKATIYIPSIFFSKNGIETGHKILKSYAKKHKFSVLMSNFCGMHWNTVSGGRSAFWNSNGQKMNELNSLQEGLLIAEKNKEDWKVKSIHL